MPSARALLALAMVAAWLATTSPTLKFLWGSLSDAASIEDVKGDVVDAVLGVVLSTSRAMTGAPMALATTEQIKAARVSGAKLIKLIAGVAMPRAVSECLAGTSCDVARMPRNGKVPPLIVIDSRRPAKECNAAFFFVHGGGWVFGEADDTLAYVLATSTGCPVISVDYALAPESRYPGAINDVAAALEWTCSSASTSNNIRNSKNLVLVGISAGGNLIAALAHKVRDTHASCAKLFVPVIPAVTAVRTMGDAAFHDNPHLSTTEIGWFLSQYSPDVEACARDPLCSPMAETNWTSLPRMAIIYARRDVLGTEAVSYAAKLRAAGYDVPLFALRGSHYAPGVRRDAFLKAVHEAATRVPGVIVPVPRLS